MAKASKVRWSLLAIIVLASLISYLDRVNLSVCAPFIMGELGFDKVDLGLTMSAFFLAYTIMQIPGSCMSERWGTRVTGTLAMVWWSIFTLLTPMAWGLYSFIVIRFLFGLGEGPFYPNNATFFSRWFNSKEKAISSASMMVGTFSGPILGPPLTVWILDGFNWHWVFYFYGLGGMAVAILWFVCARNNPSEHPRVNQEELLVITEKSSREEAQAEAGKRETAPWKKFLRNPRFWVFGLQYFTTNYIMYVFLSWIPLYLLEARGMSFTGMGFAASLPWVVLAAMVFVFGIISDKMLKAGFSKFKARVLFGVSGMTLCGICLYMAAGANSAVENIIWLSLSLGSLGQSYSSAWATCQDLGQKFGGSVAAWMNTWGNLGGFVAPTSTALMVKYVGWQATLSLTSIVILVGMLCWFFVRPDKNLLEY